MAGEYCRQHYNLATGEALAKDNKATKVLKLARGGAVKGGYLTQTNAAGKVVARDNPNSGRGTTKAGKFGSGSGGDKFTSVTHRKPAGGFKVQKP